MSHFGPSFWSPPQDLAALASCWAARPGGGGSGIGSWLLAQQSRVDSALNNLSSGLRERTTQMDTDQAIKILVAVGLAFVLLWGVNRIWQRVGVRLRKTRVWLFVRLCRAHRLPLRDQWLLWQVAKGFGLHDPAMVFVQPDLLATVAGGRVESSVASRLALLQASLFAVHDVRGESPSPILTEAAPATKVPALERVAQAISTPASEPSNEPVSGNKKASVEWRPERRSGADSDEASGPTPTPLLATPARSDLDVGPWLAEESDPAELPASG